METQTSNFTPTWINNDILELSYATIDFENQSISWKPGEFTPRRHSAIKAVMTNDKAIISSLLESII